MNINDIKLNYQDVLDKINKRAEQIGKNLSEITIVAVSKTHSVDYLLAGMQIGMTIFGENYVQELKEKYDYFTENNLELPQFHYIGHLQRNKVKYIVPFVDMIQSVDSIRLAEEISKLAEKFNRVINILVQVNTSNEESKSGCDPVEVSDIVGYLQEIPNINIQGLMSIGSFSEDESIYRSEFRLLKNISENLKTEYPKLDLKHISMGMTHDFEAAIEEGATIVRIGTAIFGNRYYKN